MGVSHCRVSNPKQSKQSMFIKVAWSGYQNLNMLQKTFTWVGDNSEFCDIRVRAMQGGFTHKGMHTHMYMSMRQTGQADWCQRALFILYCACEPRGDLVRLQIPA